MTDNSKFVLRWEIDNATAVHAAGDSESAVFIEGGFAWDVKLERNGNFANFVIGCALNKKRYWKCEGSTHLRVCRLDGTFWKTPKEKFFFGDYNTVWSSWQLPANLNFKWEDLMHTNIVANDKVTVEFHIHVSDLDRGEIVPCIFDAPNNKSNVILKIGEEKLHVSKEYLAVHSPVFDSLFFGDFAEKEKNEVELKDIVYEEFLDLLNVVYFQTAGITDLTGPNILKLADRFQMQHVLGPVQYHIKHSKGFDTVQKLVMADQYRLDVLRDHCLNSFNSFDEWSDKMKSYPEVNFSGDMKIAIYDRLMKLKPQ